jgi:PAS domain S-box-containing protein
MISSWSALSLEHSRLNIALMPMSMKQDIPQSVFGARNSNALDLEVVADTAPVMIAQMDTTAHYTSVNRAYAERFGLTPEDCVGQHVRDVVGDQAYQQIWPVAEHALAGTAVQVETEITYASLGRRRVHWSCAPQHDSSGAIVGLVAAVQDVTDVKAAEDARRKAEAFAQSILASSSDCIKVLSLDGFLEYLAPSASAVLECSELPGLVGKYWPDFFKGADREALLSAIENARKGIQGRFEGFCPTFAGTPKWWDVVVAPIAGPDGKPEKLLAVSRDITERKRTEEVLRRTEKLAATGRLAATIAHEINNPLAGVTNLLFSCAAAFRERTAHGSWQWPKQNYSAFRISRSKRWPFIEGPALQKN